MKQIKRVGVISFAKIYTLFGILAGIILGISMGMTSMQYAQTGVELTINDALQFIAENPTTGITPIFLAFGWWSVIIAPILLGIGYFVMGILLAWIFNIFTKLVGGINIDIS